MFKYLKLLFMVFVAIDTVKSLDLPFISDIQEIIGIAHDVGDIAAGNVPLKGLFVQTVNPINVIMDTVTELVEQVKDLGSKVNTKLDSILNAILTRVPLEGKIDDDMKEITTYMAKIDRKYDDFEVYSEFPEDFAEKTLRNHIDYVIGSNSGDLQDMLHSMLLVIVPPGSALRRTSLFENIKHLRNISDIKELCDLDMSFQYRLYKIYNILMMTELKAFVMSQFAYKQLSELEKTTFKGEMRREQAKFIMRSGQYQMEIKKIMNGVSREIYRCAPKELIFGTTYLQFKGLFTNYIVNEYQFGDCSFTCSKWHTVNEHKESYSYDVPGPFGSTTESISIHNKCRGKLKDCKWFGGKVEICENYSGAEERYQFVRSHSIGYYGRWTYCNGAHSYQMKNIHDLSFFSCDVCFCTCLDDKADSRAIRTISLRPQLSNIGENKVVSNLQFVMKDKIIHIQIEEAPLLSVGRLDVQNTAWVPLEDFEYFSNLTEDGSFMIKDGNTYTNLKKNVDYSFITYTRNRFNLDEISARSGYVVTGVRFNLETPSENEDDDNNSPYQLEIHVTPFDFATGQLNATDDNPSIWLTSKTQPIPPVEYTQERTEQPNNDDMKFDEPNVFSPIPVKNKYVKFVMSGRHDGGKSTVPVFDARPVLAHHSLAFDGIGIIYYQSDQECTGLIGLKVMTIDHLPYIKPNFSDRQFKYYKRLYREPLRHDPEDS